MNKHLKNNKSKMKYILRISIIFALLLIVFLGVIYAVSNFSTKGELNDDGEITVTDLSLLIKKIEKTIEYEATVREIEVNNYYPNRNEEITISLDIDVTYNIDIKTITISGKEYETVKNEQNLYEVKLNVGDIKGVKEYAIEKLTLINEEEIKINKSIKVDVLKVQPQIENWTLTEDLEKSELNISFDVVDSDEAITGTGEYIITENKEENENSEGTNYIQQGAVKVGTNNINVKVEENKKYQILVNVPYNLDTDTLEQEVDNTGRLTKDEELILVKDYEFQLSNIKIYKEEHEDKTSDEFNLEENIIVKFDSTNGTEYSPKSAIINGKKYDLTKQDNTYTTFIDGFNSTGNQKITIEKVILDNGKEFEINQETQVRIIKNAPTVARFRSHENTEEKNMDMLIFIKDKDKTITNLTAKLVDESDNEITSKDLTEYLKDENLNDSEEEDIKNTYYINTSINLENVQLSDRYKIKLIATYSLFENDENYTYTKTILENEETSNPTVSIKDVKVSNKYPEKGENITLTYKIETNKENLNITHIRVNNLRCIATKNIDEQENVTYSVTLNAGETAGIVDLNTTDIIFEGNTSVGVTNQVKIDVLKEKPTSEAFSQKDDIEKRTVTLTANIVDPDKAFITGKAELVRNSDNQIVATKTFDAEHITFEINNIELGTQYTLIAKMTYDRDTNEIEEETNKNYVEDEIFRQRPIQLIADYELKIENIKTYNGEKETKYFERGQEVTVSFDSNNPTEFYPVYAIINGKQYELEKVNQNYKTKIPVVSTFGPKTITIEKIILNNTKEIELTENNQTRVGILKLRPTITDFGYSENEDNRNIDVSFKVNDTEDAITDGTIKVINENGDKIKEEKLTGNSNGISFEKGVCEEFEIQILADYDLDTNQITTGDNEYENQQLLKEGINISAERLIEVKDIITINLYSKEDPTAEVSSITEEKLSTLDNYIVKVIQKEMPVFYAKIKSYEITEDGNLDFILDYDNVIQYENGKKQNKLKVTYGKVNNGVAENKSIEALIAEIEANPDGNFTLTQDYDVSYLKTTNSSLITCEFRGTLNGNGHKIYNLGKPLFDTLESATIQNIQLEKVNLMDATSRGSIANIATNTTIKNVHIKNLNITTKVSQVGGIVGDSNSGTIEECSVTNCNINTSGHIRVAGIAGTMTGGTIKNCYVQGEVHSTQAKDGNGIGGILGHALGNTPVTIENCITKINYVWSGGGPRLNGAIIGLGNGTVATLKNNVSLSTGTGVYKVHGGNINANASTNNYELEESELISNASGERVKKVSKDNITKEFFKDSAKFDENVWNLDDVSYDHMPTLKGNKQQENETETDTEEIDANLYIPEYDRIKNTPGFNTNKLIAYNNIQKLMPYYDAKYVVLDSVSISNTDTLNTKTIKHILPFADNKLVTYLTSKAYNGITSIKVVFTDYTVEQYEVNFEKLMGNIAIYKIPELNLSYAFGNYIINEDSEVVKKLADYIKSLDYNTVLEPLTAAADSRLYRDNYNNVIKNMAEEIALQILQNDESSILMLNNEVLNKKIEKELIGTEKINKMIYAYNYYQRWYGFEIGGARVSDILLFEGKMYSNAMTLYNVANEVLVGNLNPGGTDGFYTSCLKKYTGSSTVGYFLNYIIANIGGYEDVNDWFTEYFGARNILAEVSVDHLPEIGYRGWYQLTKKAKMILPVITLPNDCAYMISGPAHLQFGPSQLYHKDPQTEAGRTEVENKVNNHVKLVKSHFSTLADSFDYKKWNNYCIMVYDCTKIITGYKNTYFPGTNIVISTGPVYTQGKVGLEYPFFKNFSEVFGLWQPGGSSAGVGNTAGFLWFQARPGLTNFDTWTHEFEHALYDKIMLYQRGARVQLETLTEGNVQQYANWSENNLTQDVGPYYFNTSFYLNKEGNATQNLTPERINTREKLENYYKGQQNALDLLDYIEGKAFIRLTPEQQAKIATRMNISAGWTSWGGITAAQATAMNLTSLEALYDNRIVLRPNNAWGVSVRGLAVINGLGSNDYGFESVWVNRWFLGHLDGGYADAFSTKRNFFEMLGYAGVDGYVTYGSRASANDLDAIKKITKMVTGTEMDWKQYKMSRYATVEENINNNKYIDVEYMIDRFTEALTNDANKGDRNISQRTNLRKIYYHYLKSATNDFVADPLGTDVEVTHIQTAEELVEKINNKPYGYYVLDNDIDFSEMTTNVTQTFMGRLDGNGHKIIGNKIPIFNKIRYGYVGNLTLENTDIPRTNTTSGALANKIESSTAEKINVTGLKMFLGARNDLALIGGAVSNVITRECTVERLVTKISNKTEFVEKLSAEPGGLFELTGDIDFTGHTATTNTIIAGTFTGKIDGKGYTISNLNNSALFEQFNGTVENLNMENCTNTKATTDFVGIFALKSSGAKFANMKFNDVTVQGRNNVAVVVAVDNSNSTFDKISIKNANLSGSGVYIAGLVGRKYGGTVTNVYVDGNLSVTAIANAGIIGSTETNVTVSNVISDVNIERTSDSEKKNRKQNAGIVGLPISNTSRIKNSLAFGNMSAYTADMLPSKFIYADDEALIKTMLTKCYEYAEATGKSNATSNTSGNLDAISKSDLNKEFYKNLEFDENIWDLDNLNSKGCPELK